VILTWALSWIRFTFLYRMSSFSRFRISDLTWKRFFLRATLLSSCYVDQSSNRSFLANGEPVISKSSLLFFSKKKFLTYAIWWWQKKNYKTNTKQKPKKIPCQTLKPRALQTSYGLYSNIPKLRLFSMFLHIFPRYFTFFTFYYFWRVFLLFDEWRYFFIAHC